MATLNGGSSNQNAYVNRLLNKLNYAFSNEDSLDISTAASGDKLLFLDASNNYSIKYGDADNLVETLVGTTANDIALGTTAATALDFRFSTSHTTGDARGMYLRLDFDGTAASAHGGEALRTFTEIENVDVAVGGTVNSIHATMEIDGATGNVDGAGNVIRATLGGSGSKTLTGTLSGINIHLDLPSAVTLSSDLAAIRLTKTQDHEWPVFASFDGVEGNGNAVDASAKTPTGAATHAVHIKIDGTSGYIPVYDDVAFNAND